MANFLSFPTFPNCFTPMQLKMTHNGKFGQKSGLDWCKKANFTGFSIFSPKMRVRLTQSGQFYLIDNFSHLLPPKHLIFGEISKIFISGVAYIVKYFEFANFFKLFQTNAAENDPQWQIWPKTWLRLGQMANFAGFSIFSPKIRVRLTENDQFYLIHNFSHLLPPKRLIFGEISTIFISRGGIHQQIF